MFSAIDDSFFRSQDVFELRQVLRIIPKLMPDVLIRLIVTGGNTVAYIVTYGAAHNPVMTTAISNGQTLSVSAWLGMIYPIQQSVLGDINIRIIYQRGLVLAVGAGLTALFFLNVVGPGIYEAMHMNAELVAQVREYARAYSGGGFIIFFGALGQEILYRNSWGTLLSGTINTLGTVSLCLLAKWIHESHTDREKARQIGLNFTMVNTALAVAFNAAALIFYRRQRLFSWQSLLWRDNSRIMFQLLRNFLDVISNSIAFVRDFIIFSTLTTNHFSNDELSILGAVLFAGYFLSIDAANSFFITTNRKLSLYLNYLRVNQSSNQALNLNPWPLRNIFMASLGGVVLTGIFAIVLGFTIPTEIVKTFLSGHPELFASAGALLPLGFFKVTLDVIGLGPLQAYFQFFERRGLFALVYALLSAAEIGFVKLFLSDGVKALLIAHCITGSLGVTAGLAWVIYQLTGDRLAQVSDKIYKKIQELTLASSMNEVTPLIQDFSDEAAQSTSVASSEESGSSLTACCSSIKSTVTSFASCISRTFLGRNGVLRNRQLSPPVIKMNEEEAKVFSI